MLIPFLFLLAELVVVVQDSVIEFHGVGIDANFLELVLKLPVGVHRSEPFRAALGAMIVEISSAVTFGGATSYFPAAPGAI
ncbi:hypothetical protein AH06_01495 [candidate division TM6 bacterium Zodletone_IIa]|nr:hypothetical protein AH06_01495 [candidate division TM6 bacterium Zodletone_IIa]